MTVPALSLVHVVAGVLIDSRGRVLVAERPIGKHLAGAWEFPGGKLHSGEDRVAGLARELREELGISIKRPRPLLRLTHDYPDRRVLLDVWIVSKFDGEVRSLEGQRLRWCRRDELERLDLLPADKPMVAMIKLPERLREASHPDFEVVPVEALRSHPVRCRWSEARLKGVSAHSLECATAGAALGADFIALTLHQSPQDLRNLCSELDIPVYARGSSLEEVLALGASGLNCLP